MIATFVALVKISIKEDAKDPSLTIFFLGAWQKRLFWLLCLCWVAVGCSSILG
jgi:hypothetical protein